MCKHSNVAYDDDDDGSVHVVGCVTAIEHHAADPPYKLDQAGVDQVGAGGSNPGRNGPGTRRGGHLEFDVKQMDVASAYIGCVGAGRLSYHQHLNLSRTRRVRHGG